ncbi:MAG: Uma2 family endonuclease [Kofleriaceae bacterium]
MEAGNNVVLRDVQWETYVRLHRDRGDKKWPRLAFLDGELEIMTHSPEHELRKVLLARHLEAFAEERDIALNSLGNTTYRKRAKQAGLEPDVAYYVGDVGTVPHIALEVVFTSGGVDKLEIYRRLGVREVWFWIDEALAVYCLGTGGYAKQRSSKLIPELDLSDLARRVLATDPSKQTEAIRAYRKALRAASR